MPASMRKTRWGVLGVAKIATQKVIPALQRGERTTVSAIASRDRTKAEAAARSLQIPKAYGSYHELLEDPDIDAVYNPLPNHLHVPWSARAAEHGKHVLCEKPIALSSQEARQLVAVRDRTGVLIQEAFMVRAHPQWIRARELVRDGWIGQLRTMLGYFGYYNDDPANIRNVPTFGGGGLMDVGCYLINTSRFLFDREPRRIVGLLDRDPALRTDRLCSMMLDYGEGHLVGTCSTQSTPYQRMNLIGTRGRIEIEIPFNAPPDRPCRIALDPDGDVTGRHVEYITFDICDQYTIQGDLFARAILERTPAPVPLEDAVRNMECIEAVFRSAESGHAETV